MARGEERDGNLSELNYGGRVDKNLEKKKV